MKDLYHTLSYTAFHTTPSHNTSSPNTPSPNTHPLLLYPLTGLDANDMADLYHTLS